MGKKVLNSVSFLSVKVSNDFTIDNSDFSVLNRCRFFFKVETRSEFDSGVNLVDLGILLGFPSEDQNVINEAP